MSSLKYGEPSARRSVAYLSLLGTTQFHLRNPFVIACWSVAFPGMGHLLLSKSKFYNAIRKEYKG